MQWITEQATTDYFEAGVVVPVVQGRLESAQRTEASASVLVYVNGVHQAAHLVAAPPVSVCQ